MLKLKASWRVPASWVLWALLVGTALVPGLVVGYGYSGVSLRLVRWPWVNEGLYAALSVARLAPVAVLAMALTPVGGLTREGVFCARLLERGTEPLKRHRLVGWGAWVVHGRGRAVVLALGLVFLLAFNEFEVGALLAVDGWTVWLFDAQAGGVPIGETLWDAKWGVAVQLLVLGPMIALLPREREVGRVEVEEASAGTRAAGWCVVGIVSVVGMVVPVGVVVNEAVRSGGVTAAGAILPDVGSSLAFAAAGAGLAWGAAALLRWRSAAVAASAAGLLGSLVLGLSVLWLFQSVAALRPAYDTVVPYGVTLTLLLLPVAVVLGLVVRGKRDAGWRAAGLLGASPESGVRRAGARLRWVLGVRARFWALALLCAVAYFDLPAAALLTPSGLTPASVRLYNLMHYGHNAALSAMTLIAVGALGVVLVIGRGVVSAWGLRHAR